MTSKKIILAAIIPLLAFGFTINNANAIEDSLELIPSSEKSIVHAGRPEAVYATQG
jgi:hypothetical protein